MGHAFLPSAQLTASDIPDLLSMYRNIKIWRILNSGVIKNIIKKPRANPVITVI